MESSLPRSVAAEREGSEDCKLVIAAARLLWEGLRTPLTSLLSWRSWSGCSFSPTSASIETASRRCSNGKRGIHVIGATATVQQSIAEIAGLAPDVVLLDVAGEDRVAAITALVHAIPGVKVVACAVPETEHDVIPCAEAGAAACLSRETRLVDLVATIEHVASGESSASPRVAAMLLRHVATLAATDTPEAHLTAREEEVLGLIDDGLSNKQIAGRLSIELAA